LLSVCERWGKTESSAPAPGPPFWLACCRGKGQRVSAVAVAARAGTGVWLAGVGLCGLTDGRRSAPNNGPRPTTTVTADTYATGHARPKNSYVGCASVTSAAGGCVASSPLARVVAGLLAGWRRMGDEQSKPLNEGRWAAAATSDRGVSEVKEGAWRVAQIARKREKKGGRG